MKLILLLSLLFYSIISFSQNQKTTTIQLSTGDCRTNKAFSSNGVQVLNIYRLPEDTLVYKIIPRQFKQWPIKIDKVPTGNYKLIYKNNYDQEVVERLTLTEQTINAIVVCPDKLLQYPQNTLSKLQDKDTISINFQSQGCFHAGLLKLTITKENDRFIARLYGIDAFYVFNKDKRGLQYKDSAGLKTAVLNEQNIRDFARFENELNYVHDDGRCTTIDRYEVRSRYLNLKKTDGECNWDGFRYLSKSFFGEIK